MKTNRKKTRRERRKAEIVEVATEIIVEEGIEAFGVNRLARELDLTPGALYRYFDSGDDILVAVELGVLAYFSEYFEAVDRHADQASPLERVVGFVAAYSALEVLRPERFRLLSRFVSGPDPVVRDESAAQVVGPTLALLGRFAGALQGAADEGALRDGSPIERAALVWSCVQGILDRRKLSRFSAGLFDAESMLDELLGALLLGWGADADEIGAAFESRPDETTWKAILEEIDA